MQIFTKLKIFKYSHASLISVAAGAILFVSSSTYAQFDLGLSTVYRSSPQGFAADLDLGYGVVMWGSGGGDKRGADPMYGYVRSEVTLTGAPDYSAWAYQFQVFPVSFIGVVAGQSFADNEKDYDAFECSVHLCRGEFREDFTEGRLAFGFWRIFFTGKFRTSKMSEGNTTTQDSYISPDNAIALRVSEDKVKRSRMTLGFKLDNNWSVIASHLKSRAEETEQQSTFLIGGMNYTKNDGGFSAAIQAGTFEIERGIEQLSTPKKDGFTVSGIVLAFQPVIFSDLPLKSVTVSPDDMHGRHFGSLLAHFF